MTAPGLIDLGDIGAGEAGRSYPPWRWRAVVAGAVALLCLPAVTGSRPPEVGLSPLWQAHLWSPEFVIGARAVYAPSARGPVTALDLDTGRTTWTVATNEFPAVFEADKFAAVGAVSRATVVVDDDGSVVDTLPGSPVGVTRSGRHVLLMEDAIELNCPMSCARLSAWDLGDRTRTWSTVIQTLGVESDEAGRIVGVAGVANDGTLEVRDPDTGRVRGRIGSFPLGDQLLVQPSVILVGDNVATVAAERRDALITLYRLPAPDAAWMVLLPVSEFAPVDDRFNLRSCGEMLCFEVGAVGTTLIDPDRGTVALTMPIRVLGRLGGGLMMATSRILQTGVDCLGCWDVTLVDPRAGPVATYPGSMVVPWIESGGHGLIATKGPAGTGFTVLRPDGTARPIGAVPGVVIRCSARRVVLVCYAGNMLRAWRLPVPDRL